MSSKTSINHTNHYSKSVEKKTKNKRYNNLLHFYQKMLMFEQIHKQTGF